MNHNVGDILWIVTSERPGLITGQVSEEIIKKTLKGEQKIYTVDLARGTKVIRVTLDKIKGDIYSNASEAKAAMLKDAEGAIDELISYNNSNVEKYFTATGEKDTIVESKNDSYDYEYVELENGQKAKVKIPKELKNARKNN